MAKPIIVIATGSFSPASEYDALMSHLGSSGYEAFAYDLPTTRKKPADGLPASTLAEDAMFINGVCAGLCDQAQNVVVLGHSYGGMVVSEAVKGLTEKRVGKGRVLGLVYLTAAAVKEGQSLGDVTADLGFDFIKMDGEFMYHDPIESSAAINFSDLPADKALEAAKRFTYHSAPSFGNPLQHAGYAHAANVAYIFCTADKTLPPAFQKAQIANIDAARGSGREAKVYELEGASHCPHTSRPVDVARAVSQAVGDFI